MDLKKVKTLLFLIILFFVSYGDFNIKAQETQVKKSLDKVMLAEQIPEKELTFMTTEQLIQKYLNSRYSRYIFLYPDDVNYAFKKAYNDFNGLRELLKRNNAVKSLIEIYQSMDPGGYDVNWEPAKKGNFSFLFVYIEILLAHDNILNNLAESETKTVLKELLKKNKLKTLHPELYSLFDIQFNAYSIAKLLESKGKNNGVSQSLKQTQGMNDFLNSGRLQNKEVLSIVFQKAKEFLNAN
ncbi:MAG: hypothetical protein HY963_03090 [Ignavibacteriales bacterium]|nr:hypothetical protein [Ignavibacteriales bacterium]